MVNTHLHNTSAISSIIEFFKLRNIRYEIDDSRSYYTNGEDVLVIVVDEITYKFVETNSNMQNVMMIYNDNSPVTGLNNIISELIMTFA